MAGPLRHLGELAKARATRRSSERADSQALAELEARPLQLPAGLEVEWLGVSGYRLTYEGRTLFVDPYLSRVPLPRPRAAAPGAARPGGARPLRRRPRRGRRRPRRPHPLRPRRRRAGDRQALRLQGLRLALAAEPDGPARPRRADGRGRALPHLRARPVRGLLHAQRPLEAAARARRPLRRRTDLRAPRRALPRRLPLRPGLGHLDRGRRHCASTTRAAPTSSTTRSASATSTSSSPASPAAASPTATGSGSSPASTRAPSSPPTTTTSSARSASGCEFVANVQLAELPDEIGAVSRDIELAALPRTDSVAVA